MERFAELGGQVAVGLMLLVAGVMLAAYRARQRQEKVATAALLASSQEREAFLEQIRLIFEGRPANVFTGEVERPGLVPQLNAVREEVTALRRRQEEIGAVAVKAAEDVAAVRHELTRNGGDSTKDAAHQASRSAEAAAAASEVAARESTANGDLLRRHLTLGEEQT